MNYNIQAMYRYINKLYTNTNSCLDGELVTSMSYLTQRYALPNIKVVAILNDMVPKNLHIWR